MNPIRSLVLACSLASLFPTGLHAQAYYRYRDANGVMRMELTIPAE